MVTTRAKFKRNQNNIKSMVGSNDDLLIEILRRLPAKSIIRFKSVSKHWQSLLSRRYFTLLFDNLSISRGFFYQDLFVSFDVENQSPKPFHSLNFFHNPPNIRLIQSCNGLLLCRSLLGPESFRKYYVVNPTTKQSVVIPPVIGIRHIYSEIFFMGLAYRHTNCANYKVVCVCPAKANPKHDKNLYQIQIYSSETGKWRILVESFPISLSMCLLIYVVYWNEAIYWYSHRNLFYFILDSEHLQHFPLPLPNYDENGALISSQFNITESQGHLHLAEHTLKNGRLRLNVYEMLSDHSGWVLKYQVEHHKLHELYALFGSDRVFRSYEFRILDVVRGEKEEDTFMLVKVPNKIMRYNMFYKSLKPLFDLRGIIPAFESQIYRYIESISSF